jgi:hypothetical protein
VNRGRRVIRQGDRFKLTRDLLPGNPVALFRRPGPPGDWRDPPGGPLAPGTFVLISAATAPTVAVGASSAYVLVRVAAAGFPYMQGAVACPLDPHEFDPDVLAADDRLCFTAAHVWQVEPLGCRPPG